MREPGSGGFKIVELIASIVESRRGCCSETLMKSLRVAESHQLYRSLSLSAHLSLSLIICRDVDSGCVCVCVSLCVVNFEQLR